MGIRKALGNEDVHEKRQDSGEEEGFLFLLDNGSARKIKQRKKQESHDIKEITLKGEAITKIRPEAQPNEEGPEHNHGDSIALLISQTPIAAFMKADEK